MSMMVSFVLSFFPRDVLDEILNLIESVSEDFPSYSFKSLKSLEFSDAKTSDVLSNVVLVVCMFIFIKIEILVKKMKSSSC